MAVSADGASWFLINASPEIRAQIESFSGLWPRQARHSPIAGVLLTNGDLDHCLGLLSLRESHPIVVFASESVRAGFTGGNVLYRTLERFPGQVTWRPLELGREVATRRAPGGDGGCRSGQVAVAPRAAARALAGRQRRAADPRRHERPRVAYFSGVAGPSPELSRAVAGADVTFFDGTFWSSDELIAAGLGTRRAEEMAHWPVGGPSGSLAFLRQLPGRKILIHVNNTNPILREDSPERRMVTDAGVEVAHDGMEIDGMEIDWRRDDGRRRSGRPTSWWRACARKACAATTISIRFTASCTRGG